MILRSNACQVTNKINDVYNNNNNNNNSNNNIGSNNNESDGW